jgi:putative phosphoesterase
MGDAAIIGLISDTHGLMRPEALSALKGSELIVHAGDIGKPEIIEQLSAVAPVVAVRGNVDGGDCALRLPTTAVAETRSALIYIPHDVQQLELDEFIELLERDLATARSDVVTFHPLNAHRPSRGVTTGFTNWSGPTS